MVVENLLALPNELLRTLCSHLSPSDAISLSRTCKRLNITVDDRALWREHFFREYKTFSDPDEAALASQKPLTEVDWRKRFVDRATRDKSAKRIFEELLVREHLRWDKIADITAAVGTECEELFESDRFAVDGLEDSLSRRYWAARVITQARKRWAVDLWSVKSDDQPEDLLLVASAFDAFISGRDYRINSRIDAIASDIRRRHPDLPDLATLEEQVVIIIDYLRENHYVGERNIQEYHSLHNNFLSHALKADEKTRSSMPLTSNLVLHGICRRFGISTTLCHLPGHVQSGIWRTGPPEIEASDKTTHLADFYVDPWRHNGVISRQGMVECARTVVDERPSWGMQSLNPMTAHQLLQRMWQNISNSLEAEHRALVAADPEYPAPEAVDAVNWCQYLTSPTHKQHAMTYLAHQMRNILEDSRLCEKVCRIKVWPYDSPTPNRNRYFSAAPTGHADDLVSDANGPIKLDPLLASVKACLETSLMPIEPRRRNARIRFRIGQVFRHRRYGYSAVITGWDARCQQSHQWQRQMGIAQLSGGAGQPYYHARVADGSSRYVAAENIEVVSEALESDIVPSLGEYFKRWDGEKKQFVSNLVESYPDD